MKHIYSPLTALLLGCTVVSGQAVAAAANVDLHGFVRSAFDTSSSSAPYLETIDNKGDFGGTFAGLNYSTLLNNQWSVAGQLFYKAGEGEMTLDWAFATFRPNDATAVRFGRQKYPLGLVSENVDIGITYPWARPPMEFYHMGIGSGSPNIVLENYDGLSLAYTAGDDWEFTLQPFVGQHGYSDASTANQRQMLGLKMEAAGDIATLQAGYIRSKLNITGDIDNQTKTTWNLGAKLELDNLLAYLEYADTQVNNSVAYDSNAGYGTIGYTFGDFLPSLTYATVAGQSGNMDQDSVTAAVAYTYNPVTVFKAQWQRITPDDPTTAGLINELPDGETTADIFSFTMDLVF